MGSHRSPNKIFYEQISQTGVGGVVSLGFQSLKCIYFETVSYSVSVKPPICLNIFSVMDIVGLWF